MSVARDRARALQAAAIGLAYPDAELIAAGPLLASTAAALPPATGAPLGRFAAHLAREPLDRLAADYVATFDLRRRCCLNVTYYAHGDTRKRGMALLRFTHAYRAAGLRVASGELPDHLAVVCEVAARAPEVGLPLLADHRAGVELLRRALTELRSPYADLLDAIDAALPEAAPRDLAAALALARSGPPAEEVGLEPFAPPERAEARR